ncbi:hypothetical protein L6E12_01370 [Actinokineospora sp. PR83]|uniref:hypothetical protein n=1 Tax=Actinokineospora sp. PR83 TaxID=2884908 RepID=UPI001F187E85|nr:hypothetical protein [Actinokineospora sp. PR83]MCG8914446.1 hypothetical protein [Actinokineospora sp. PR83]
MKPWGIQEIAGVIGVFTLVTVVIGVTIWQLGTSWRAKAALAREASYRQLAERTVVAQEETRRELAEITARFGDLQQRVDSVERILKEIE